jgi:hypothetical protein
MFDYRLRHKRRAQGMQPLPAKPFEMILDPGQPGCMHDLSGHFILGGDSQGGTALRGPHEIAGQEACAHGPAVRLANCRILERAPDSAVRTLTSFNRAMSIRVCRLPRREPATIRRSASGATEWRKQNTLSPPRPS